LRLTDHVGEKISICPFRDLEGAQFEFAPVLPMGRFFGAKVIQLTQANQGLEADTMGRTSGERKAP